MCSASANIGASASASSAVHGRSRSRSVSSRKSSSTGSTPYRARSAPGRLSSRSGPPSPAEERSMDVKGKRLRLLYSDVLGVERGKYLFGDVADDGRAAFCIGVFPLTTDREILDISRQQFDVGLPDVEAFVDRDTLRPGWEDDTIIGIADVQQHGEPLDVDPRQVLRKAVEPWREMDLEPMFAFESEFYLLERGEDSSWKAVDLGSHRSRNSASRGSSRITKASAPSPPRT